MCVNVASDIGHVIERKHKSLHANIFPASQRVQISFILSGLIAESGRVLYGTYILSSDSFWCFEPPGGSSLSLSMCNSSS